MTTATRRIQILHVQLLAVHPQAGDGDGGLVAVVQDDEVLVNATHFVTRVGMKSVDAREIETEDDVRYGNSLQVGVCVCVCVRVCVCVCVCVCVRACV